MWFSTEFGVSRFNGFQFENFNLENGLPDNDVFKLFQDSKGRIWIFMSNGGAAIFENGKILSERNTPFLKKLKVSTYFNGFLEEPDGSIWLTTVRDGVFKLSPERKITHLKPLADLAGTTIAPGIWKDTEGQVKIFTQAGIINLSKNPGLTEVPFQSISEAVRFGKNLRNGKQLVGMGNKLLLLHPPENKIQVISQQEGYQDHLVSNIAESPEGNLWISAINGLHFYKKGILSKEQHRVYLKGKTISGFLFDRQGNLWVSTLNEGVFLITDQDAIFYDKWDGIPEIPITSIACFQNKVFFGNDRGKLGNLENGKIKMLPMPAKVYPFGRGRIREFRQDPFLAGITWVVSENGLMLTDGNSILSYFPSATKTIEFLQDQLFMGNGYTCATIPYHLHRKTGKIILKEMQKINFDSLYTSSLFKITWDEVRHLLPETRVYKLQKDEGGTLWMATNSGLYSLQFGKVIFHKEENAELGYPFQNLCLLGDGTLALSSNGRGVLLLRPNGKTQWISRKDGLSSNYIRNLKSQGKDGIWVCTPSGLNLISVLDGDKRFQIRKWTSTNSALLSNDVFDISNNGDTLWLAIGARIQCIPAFFRKKNYSNPPPTIEKTILDGIIQAEGSNQLEAMEGASLKITLRNPDFRNLDKVSLQYRLLPDTNWKSITGNFISETFREQGEYSIEIRKVSDQIPEETLPFFKVNISRKLAVLSALSDFSYTSRITIVLGICLLLMVLGGSIMASQKKLEPESNPDLWNKITEIQTDMLQNKLPSENTRELFLAFRKMAEETSAFPTLQEEISLSKKYIDFLKALNPDLFIQISISPELENENIRLTGHPITTFVLRRIDPSSLPEQPSFFRIQGNETKLYISFGQENFGQISYLDESLISIPVLKKASEFSAIILPLKRFFQPLPSHHKPLSPPS